MGTERVEIKGRSDSARTNLAKIGMFWAPVKRRTGGDPEAAMKLLKSSIALVRETLEKPQPQPDSPTKNEILELLATLLQNEGVEYLEQGRLPETSASFQEALDTMATVLNNIRTEPGFAELTDDQKDSKTASRQISQAKC